MHVDLVIPYLNSKKVVNGLIKKTYNGFRPHDLFGLVPITR
jgi:hypothetical protein